ncbi:response regulator [Fibrella forsythiae]|uniref:Response regulator n=1 Tax=Fibrella forsythiae TaxID=2817061 RepID=A0ABS3JSY0_9BACT|nr:response regulator [Fibrella forsythiae]MBO0953093.1 response regulator [Fibrella forsythiae]
MITSPLHVLLVDDDEEDQQLVAQALTSAIDQITVQPLSSGQALIDWLAQQRSTVGPSSELAPVTIILLDMHMPTLSGLETLDYLGDMSQLPYMPVVMLTASMSDQLKLEAYQRGIHLFMLKPTGSHGFYRVVEAIKLCYRDALRVRERDRLRRDFH